MNCSCFSSFMDICNVIWQCLVCSLPQFPFQFHQFFSVIHLKINDTALPELPFPAFLKRAQKPIISKNFLECFHSIEVYSIAAFLRRMHLLSCSPADARRVSDSLNMKGTAFGFRLLGLPKVLYPIAGTTP